MHFSTGEILGSIGVTILLLAFLMNLLQKWKQDSLPYILLNIVGAGLSCVSSVFIRFFPFIILEAAWMLVSFFALIKYFKPRL
jgi:Ca2+/Na+ antiporter